MNTPEIIFLIVIATSTTAEIIYDHLHHLRLYNFRDTCANLAIFVCCLSLNLLMRGLFFGAYTLLYHHAWFNIGYQWWAWLLLLPACDFNYYWFHRLGHRVRFFWASHVVHHSSEQMNLSIALRSPVMNIFYRSLMHAPLALIGFKPEFIILIDSIIVFYTFINHTETIRSLGFFENVLNTPSHHRVHHGRNEQYLDKNYGGLLIIWDKLSGTYEPENEKCEYGLTHLIQSHNPIVIVFHEWEELLRDMTHSRDLSTAFNYLIKPPGWKPPEKAISQNLTVDRIQKKNIITRSSPGRFDKKIACIALLLMLWADATAQSTGQMLQIARQLKDQFKYEAALSYYEQVLNKEPANVEALSGAALMFCHSGARFKDVNLERQNFQNASELALKAIRLDDHSVEAHCNYLMALGLLCDRASGYKQKLAYANSTKAEAEKILHLSPDNAFAHYALGRWNLTIAGLNPVEVMIANALFGKVPGGASYQAAIEHLQKAVQLDSDFIMYQYGLALGYKAIGKSTKAIQVLKSAIRLPRKAPEDEERIQKCEMLLHKLGD